MNWRKLSKKDIILLLIRYNDAFSAQKLNRKTRDQLLLTYEATIRRLASEKVKNG